jgi:hypothetical protein
MQWLIGLGRLGRQCRRRRRPLTESNGRGTRSWGGWMDRSWSVRQFFSATMNRELHLEEPSYDGRNQH